MSHSEHLPHQSPGAGDLVLLLGGGIGLYLALSAIGQELEGPSYLVAFAVMWAFLMLVHTAVRRTWCDSFAVSVVAAGLLAAVALSRYRWGVERGMQRWGLLVLMTMLGCAAFFFRVSQLHSNDGGRKRSSEWATGCGATSAGGGCGASGGGGGC